MNNLEVTYKLVKKVMVLKEELVNWGRLSRESKLTQSHELGMLNQAHEIDELLREIGVEWVEDYEANQKIRESIQNG